jgi:hypothetical protein
MSIRDPSSRAEGCWTLARLAIITKDSPLTMSSPTRKAALDRCDVVATGDRDRRSKRRP